MQYIQATGHGWTVYLDFLLSVIIKPFTAKHIDLFVYFGSRRGAKHVDLCGRDIFYISWFLCYVMLCYIIMLLLQASLRAISPIPYWTCRVISKVQTKGARVLPLVRSIVIILLTIFQCLVSSTLFLLNPGTYQLLLLFLHESPNLCPVLTLD